jgi:hypothetical protein
MSGWAVASTATPCGELAPVMNVLLIALPSMFASPIVFVGASVQYTCPASTAIVRSRSDSGLSPMKLSSITPLTGV